MDESRRDALGLDGNFSRNLALGIRTDNSVAIWRYVSTVAWEGGAGEGNVLRLDGDLRGDGVLRRAVDDLGDDFVALRAVVRIRNPLVSLLSRHAPP